MKIRNKDPASSMSDKSGNNMTTLADIELDKIDDPKEKEILKLLKEKEKCLYGNILKELTIPVQEGQKIIMSLLSRGLIRYHDHSFYLELNVRLK